METLDRHVERIMSAAYGGFPVASDTEIPGQIYRSWVRCIDQHKLHPAKPVIGRVETSTRLRESRDQIEDYLHVARAGMEQLYKCVSGLGYVLLLADAEGVTVDYIGDDSWDQELRKGGLHLGANWKEQYAGTNGIGTCVIEQTPMVVHRDDHFFLSNTGLSCITTPLFDPEGGFMGVLDVSALSSPASRESSQLALGLTTLHGRMIEDANFMRHFGDRWILRLATAGALTEVSAELMLALDSDGVVVGANSGARRRLRVPAPPGAGISLPLVGRPLSAVFRDPMEALQRLRRVNSPHDRAVLNTVDHVSYFASLLPPRAARKTLQPLRADAASVQPASASLDPLAGDDRNMRRVIDQAKRIVNKRINVLIQGETGTGKEVFARAMHDASLRADKPFIAINCAAIPETLIESELFGYTAGTFTGARTRGMKGLIQQSDGGTLFLDEIGDMPLPLQTRLLRVLSEREVVPLGSDKPIALDLTVIAASHRDLRRQIAAGSFREDLYYRLCGATLSLLPLRERQDKGYLIDTVLQEEASRLDAKPWLHEQVEALLHRYEWPGNVRQLRNVLRFAVAMSDGEGIFVEHLPPEIIETLESAPTLMSTPVLRELAAPSSGVDAAPASESRPIGPSLPPEAQPLIATLRRHKWNISAAALELGTNRTTVYRQMKRYGITPPTHW